uniref:Uncharacterized protein n=1 Tax=Arundo donax TaxID=35708 RepID=A0A0A9B7C7_ARUDO
MLLIRTFIFFPVIKTWHMTDDSTRHQTV